jgi:hypothetical protein
VTRTLLPAAALVIALSLTACPSSPSTGPKAAATSRHPGCEEARRTLPAWFPRDLPLPHGTVVSQKPTVTGGFHRVWFVVPLSVRALRRYVRTKWAAAGYVLGQIAVGHGRFTVSFVKAAARGTLLAQTHCGKGKSTLYLGYLPGSPSPSSS